MRYKALLLDFDNTIVGTESAHYYLFKKTIGGLIGRELTPADGHNFAGCTWKCIFAKLSETYLPDMKPEEIREIFIKAKSDYFRGRAVPVAKGLSALLDLDVKRAIVTGSSRAEVDMFADYIDLSRFDLIASDELYENGKPAPDAYIYAAGSLGLCACDCLAVEDSKIGLTSARSAGAVTVFTREFADEDHSGIADYTVSTIGEVLSIIV